ncbi:MAG: hypothetical protein WBB53_02130, partial [Ferruginibacter sp.]
MLRLIYKILFFSIIHLSFIREIYAQNNLPGGDLNGSVITLICANSCVPLSVKVPHLKSATDYKVIEIPFKPFKYIVEDGHEDSVRLYSVAGGSYCVPFPLPFNFCFYGQSYSKVMVCGNGYLSFDISLANWGSGSNGIGNTLPYFEPDTSTYIAFLLRSTIMGMFSTFDTRRCDNQAPAPPNGFPQCSSPYDRRIQWRVEGTAPSRKFIASYYKIGNAFYDSTS